MGSKERLDLFRGKAEDVEKLEQSNVIRIFISSTFSDMAVERNLLLEKAYPTLRKFCQQMGLQLQVMDMRWGIQDAANVDHSTCQVCLQEIKTCRRLSMGPYFVAFLGNRYGYRPIPSSISLDNYEIFCQIMKDHQIDNCELVLEWYKRDDNASPPCYILQPITSKYPWFDDANPANAEKRYADRKSWTRVSNNLSECLRQCAKLAIEENKLGEEEGMLFFKSVTEMEIEEGLTRENPSKAIHLYRREITDINSHVNETAAQLYLDIKEVGKVDNEAQKLLYKLKTDIENLTGASENIKTYEVKWISDKGISPNSKVHMTYLEKFCSDFIRDIQTSIRLSVDSWEQTEQETLNKDKDQSLKSDWVFEEVTHQASFVKKKCEIFHGRKQLISGIYDRLFDQDLTSPVSVFGKSGKGKTALMAMIVQCCREKKMNNILVYRFFGTSPNSSQIHHVLQTLILQITEAFGLPIPELYLLQNFNSVVQRFSKCLREVSRLLEKDTTNTTGSLVIILDSLDQLSPLDGAHRLNWLPKQLPSRVKILLSTLPDPKLGILKKLRLSFPGKAFVEVTDLDADTGREILDAWLAKENRTLTAEQYKLIFEAFLCCPTPLFLKLAFDEARSWHSYTDITSLRMADTARGAISLFFDRLESIHGHLFVSRAIGYLVASKNGLTESELEDLLSLDDEVLDGSYTHWSPPSSKVVRIPSLLWTRLRHDLGGDIVERQTVGHTVLALYHRQFVEVARERYLGESIKTSLHETLAHYFLGTWADGRKKPLKLRVWKNKTIDSDRQVSSQPYKFSDRVFNFRKFDELPFQLLQAKMWETLNDVVLCSATWLEYKIQAFAIKDVIDDYNMVLENRDDSGISLIRDALKLAKPTLEFPGGIRNPLCSELYGRLAYYANAFPATIGKLVAESSQRLHNTTDSLLIPLRGCFQPPGGPLRTTLTGFTKPITCMETTHDKSMLIAGSYEGLLVAWQMGSDEVMYTTQAHQDEIKCLAISGAGTRLVSGSLDNTLRVTNVDSGSKVAVIKEDHTGYENHASVAMSYDGNVVVSACGAKINVWDVNGLQCTFSFVEKNQFLSCPVLLVHDSVVIAGFVSGLSVCWSALKGQKLYEILCTKDNEDDSTTTQYESAPNAVVAHHARENRYLSWLRNGTMSTYDDKTGARISTFDLKVSGLVSLSANGDAFAVSNANIIHVWTRSNASIQYLGNLRHHHNDITSMKFDDAGKTLVVGSKDEQISTWAITTDPFTGDQCPLDIINGMGAGVDHLVLLDKVVASASSKVFYIKLWNLERKKIVDDPESYLFQVDNNAISPCGNFLAIFDNFEKDVKIHDICQSQTSVVSMTSLLKTSASKKSKLEVENFSCSCISFLSASDYILCGTNVGSVFKISNSLITKKFSTPTVTSVNLSPDEYGAPVLVMHSCLNCKGCLVVTRDMQNHSQSLFLLDTSSLSVTHSRSAVDFNITGKITAACLGNVEHSKSYAFVGTENCLIYVISLEKFTDENNKIFYKSNLESILSEHESPVSVLAICPNQKFVYSGSRGKTRRLWHLKDEKWELHIQIYFKSLLEAGATHVAFTRDGKYVASGSHERSLKVWQAETGKLVAAQYVYATVTGITTTDDNRIMATTKMGYVIEDKFYLGKSRESDNGKANSPKQASQKPIPVARSNSSTESKRTSSACSIV